MMSMITKWKLESEEIAKNIFIPSSTHDYAYNRDVRALFQMVVPNPVGKRLLEKIHFCASEIHISYGDKDQAIQIHNQ